ncbi:MAG: sterol carrier protein domain-containing protein [Candidatus Marinimicrobia bacterium]|nr:sterol carrier protein domain-containing protein [Candidatus Neomarinimicrobiota bacterium]
MRDPCQQQLGSIPFTVITGVLTSRIARKQGLAAKLTAKVLARDAANGADMAGLGIFDQGFYDRLGFGTVTYDHWISFDPASITIDQKYRSPKRLTADNYKEIQYALINRIQPHGSINILQEHSIHAELHWTTNGFGLGYYDGPNDELSHFVWIKPKGEYGPYDVIFYAFRTNDQFRDLMVLLKSLGDQVRMIRMREPSGIQLQDIIDQPFRHRGITAKGEYENIGKASAYNQSRILNIEECIRKTRLPFGEIDFNLEIHDPVSQFLDKDDVWQGTSGKYTIHIGQDSKIENGFSTSLPNMKASIGAFTRIWMGVRPATGLAATDNINAPQSLLEELDILFRLPPPKAGWDY